MDQKTNVATWRRTKKLYDWLIAAVVSMVLLCTNHGSSFILWLVEKRCSAWNQFPSAYAQLRIMVSGSVISTFELYRFRTLKKLCRFRATVWVSPKYYLITIVLEFAIVQRHDDDYDGIIISRSVFPLISCAHYLNECVTRWISIDAKTETHTLSETYVKKILGAERFMRTNQNAKHLNVLQMIIIIVD